MNRKGESMAEIVVRVCPECGADIIETVICTYPPIPSARCTKCGWHWEGKSSEIVRIPFVDGKRHNATCNNVQVTGKLGNPYKSTVTENNLHETCN